MKQPVELMGKETVRMLLRRLREDGADVPGKWLPCSFTIGASTRPVENKLLEGPEAEGILKATSTKNNNNQ